MSNTTLPTAAQNFIPQRPPMAMIDRIVTSEEEYFTTDFLIRADNVFVENGIFREAGIMENIAQTCAARIGFCAANNEVPRGVIGGISGFTLHARPRVGDTLLTTIDIVAGVGGAMVVDAQVEANRERVATCSMKVFISQ